jgi:pimeloyl-ACP methyl ester carboxylesterase
MSARYHLWLCVVVPFLGLAGAAAQEKPTRPALEQAARVFVEQLAKGEVTAAAQGFDATMTKVMPPEKLKKTWEDVLTDNGAFQRLLGTRHETKGKYDIVFVTGQFAKRKTDTRVVFDKDGKITGLFFSRTPPTGTAEVYEGKLKAGPIEVRLVFKLFKQKDGSYAGTMDSPDQGAAGLVFDVVSVKDDLVRLEMTKATIVFEGKRGKDGKELDGTFKQAGQSFPLALRRAAKTSELRRPQTPRPPFPYDAVEVAYANKPAGIKLAGTLTLPRGKGPFPAVLLISGSGPQDRDSTLFGHKPFLVLADYLTRRGIAVLRVDDRGVGGSTGKTMESTSADFAQDVLSGVAFLKTRPEIDAAKIGLIGHSEGGIIAPLVASQSKDIAFIVLLAGTGLPGEDVLYTQGAAIAKTMGADAATLARQKALQQRIFAMVRAEKDTAVLAKRVRAALAEAVPKDDKEKTLRDALPAAEGQVKMVTTPWFRHFLDYDPRPALRKVGCPVLALCGSKDVQVDAKINLPVIEAALKEGGNRDVTVQELPNVNHLFQTCKIGAVGEYATIEETVAPAVLEAIARWIQKRTSEVRGP